MDRPTTEIDPIEESSMGSAKAADRIIVMKNGEIAEMGSHGELMETGEFIRILRCSGITVQMSRGPGLLLLRHGKAWSFKNTLAETAFFWYSFMETLYPFVRAGEIMSGKLEKRDIRKVPLSELEQRIGRIRAMLDKKDPEWKLALIISKINQYYFTGTMQEGLLFIPRDGEAVYLVRRSYERAADESLFPDIRPIESYRDAAAAMGKLPETVHIETEFVPLAMCERLKKYFGFTSLRPLDAYISAVRSVKSKYELDLMARAGEIHRKVLEEKVPSLLRDGMTESELSTAVYSALVEAGHQGTARFNMFDTEVLLGHVAFGESSLYPTYFNGPGGNYGLGPAVQMMGSRERRLSDGDLVFVDTGCGYEGYQSDKTMTYVFGKPLPKHAVDIHKKCLDIQERIAGMLKPGEIPSRIYQTIMNSVDEVSLPNFMGYGKRRVKFLGHGIGLQVDELPVLAKGFDEPLQEGMVFAVEPKAGVEGVGMVGIENTFIVTPDGGKSITGNSPGLIYVPV